MRKTNAVLLVCSDIKELKIIEENLSRNGFEFLKAKSLNDALIKVEKDKPDLIIISSSESEQDIELFRNRLKTSYIKKVLSPSSINWEDYINFETIEHLVIRSLRQNKSSFNKKVVFFIFRKTNTYSVPKPAKEKQSI